MDEFAKRDKTFQIVKASYLKSRSGGGSSNHYRFLQAQKKNPKPKTNIKRGRNSFEIQFPKLFTDLYYFSKMIFYV